MNIPGIPDSVSLESLKEALSLMGFSENANITELKITPGFIEVEVLHMSSNYRSIVHKVMIEVRPPFINADYPYIQ